jgi:hypothetical protein
MADINNEKPTEIRCQEKFNGGLSYEILLAVPVAVTPPKRPSSPRRNASAENIVEKLKAAEERRLSLRAKRLADVATEISKIGEASKRKKELIDNFISKTRENIERRMKVAIANREILENAVTPRIGINMKTMEDFLRSLKDQETDVVE